MIYFDFNLEIYVLHAILNWYIDNKENQMTFENDGNSFAIEHLINLERNFENKKSETYKHLIDAIGEAGGSFAVGHLIELEINFENKKSETYKHLIDAIGRAGRIS